MLAMVALTAVGVGGFGVNNISANRGKHTTQEIVATERGELAYRPLDIKKAYRTSEAVLLRQPFKMQFKDVFADNPEQRQLFHIDEKISMVNERLIGTSKPQEKPYYSDILSPKEINFYKEKGHLPRLIYPDRSDYEAYRTKLLIGANKAKFLGAVKTKPGIRYNIYEIPFSNPNYAEPDIQINAAALDTLTQYLISELSNLGPQSKLPNAEITRLQGLAAEGKLDDVTISLLFAKDASACALLNSTILDPYCAGAVMTDGSSRQTATSSKMRNMAVALAYRGPSWLPVDHEISHALMGMTRLTSTQRIEGSPAEAPWQNEHVQVVFPLDAKVTKRKESGMKIMLEPIKYTGFVFPKPGPIFPDLSEEGKGGNPGKDSTG